MRLSLIGPGDVKFHYSELLGIKEEDLGKELEGIAESLVESNAELELLPDDGICIEIARRYKSKGGKKVVGAVPKSDKTFGIRHLERYIHEKNGGKPLFDEIIDTENWFKHDLIKGLLGNAVLYLGASPGTDGERHYAVYLYKLMQRFKKGVEISGRNIHPEIKAANNYAIFVYSKFLMDKKLPKEDEAYMKKFGVNLVYINNPQELKSELKKFSQDNSA